MNELFVDYIIFAKKERMESLKQRRTIRKYQQKDISADLLNDLLETSFRASTVGNMQVYSVIVTRDAERKAKLAPAHFNQPMVRTAPVVLTFCIDLRRFSKWCEQRKAEPGYNNFEWFVTGAVDTLLVAQTFCVAAEEKGLGICYLGTTTYNPQMIVEALELPELVFPITTVTVGWPAEQPEQVDRLPLEALYTKRFIMIILLRTLTGCMPIKNRFLRTSSSSWRTIRKRWRRSLQMCVIRRKTVRQCRRIFGR